MTYHSLPIALAALLSLFMQPGAALASPEGVWRTEPDAKGQVAHVQATQCGTAYCGTIIKVFAPNGDPVPAPTVGQRVFWDMTGQQGTYKGRAFVPAHNRSYDGKMEVDGNRMRVSGCLGPVCQSQTWQRVR